ncbi:subtilisin-like protein [Cubamyces sp. BRFM 1775]|nr:subtilisin-like protein [Cubamyces sp. BRFM 1775]
MVYVFGTLLGLALVGFSIAKPVDHAIRDAPPTHEARSAIPSGFVDAGPASSNTMLKLRFALAQLTPDAIVNALYSVSDPKSAQYGRYLSKSEVEQLVAPKPDAVSAVNAWLQENGFTGSPLSPAGDWVGFEIPVEKANDLFHANFSVFTHGVSGARIVRTMSYSLPESLEGHVDLVHPTTSFPDPSAKGMIEAVQRPVPAPQSLNGKRDLAANCTNGTIPACLQELYNIPLTPAKNPSNRIGVTGRYGNIAHYAGLKQFLTLYRPDMDPNTNFTVDSVDGGVNDQDGPSASEADLDIQYTVGLATDVPVVFIYVNWNTTDGALDGYLDEVNQLLAEENPPQVLTTSYGAPETALSFALTDKLCKQYAQLGARGVSILYASGDSGVGCPEGDDTRFQPTFPSNCPFVTSVGGTAGFAPETAWPGSSGGFSNYYPRPAYQDAAVQAYLAQNSSDPSAFNVSGRAFPDVSAKADGFIVYIEGLYGLTGTSASSPTVASVIALLNDRLASEGKPPLGFLNPWLYSDAATAFTDVTTGNSTITCSAGAVPRGFDAVSGWDPVTGLGSPNFEELADILGF